MTTMNNLHAAVLSLDSAKDDVDVAVEAFHQTGQDVADALGMLVDDLDDRIEELVADLATADDDVDDDAAFSDTPLPSQRLEELKDKLETFREQAEELRQLATGGADEFNPALSVEALQQLATDLGALFTELEAPA
jgi:hypothetical protein